MSYKPNKTTVMLLPAVILTGLLLLPSGCATRNVTPARPDFPATFHFLEPGSTNLVVVPLNCDYGIWTTDRGLLYLQGVLP